ncbi:MAG: type II secretion system protein [Candidatus Gastranaerophilaceae bacterium]
MKKGFTLAEVLITLVVIGVIASFTIPAVINAQNDKEVLARLKKSYSALSQVMMTTQALNGSFTDWGMQDNNTASIEYTFNHYILPYIKNMKKCINTSGCWTNDKTKAFDGNGYASTAFDTGMGQNNITFILNDGSFVSMDIYGDDIDEVFGITENTAFPTLTFAVDINGDKGPNQVGKDVFFFVQTKNGLVPAGKDNASARCYTGANGGYAGYDCAAKVLKTGSVQY